MHDGTFDTFKASRKERIDIRVSVERRRRWRREEKLRIVRESLEPNAVVSEVARRNESWRCCRMTRFDKGSALNSIAANNTE